MVWHQQPRLRTREAAFEGIGLLPSIDSQGIVVLAAAEAAGKRPPQPVDIVTYWIGDQKIQVSGDIAMIDFVPQTTILYGMSSLTMRRCTYFRIGDWLQVIGSFDFVPSDEFADMAFSMAPPIAHVFNPLTNDLIPIDQAADLPRVRFNLTINSEFIPANDRIMVGFTNAPTSIAAGTASFMYWARIPE